jgi:tetratricopeptide (TPR) repeat protein
MSVGLSVVDTVTSGNTSGGNTGIMGNMSSAGNIGEMSNPGFSLSLPGTGGGVAQAPRKQITADQITDMLRQVQAYQSQGRSNAAIDLYEQILASGFDRSEAHYLLGWFYQEQQHWDDAIHQFQMLLNNPDYALSCYYALGQCYRAQGDLRTASVHFDEAVDQVNLDVLTVEESDQLVQLCQEAAEVHRLLGEQAQALTIYGSLLGFLQSRGWSEKVAQVEFLLQQARNAPVHQAQQVTPPPENSLALSQDGVPPLGPASLSSIPEVGTIAFNASNLVNVGRPQSIPPAPEQISGLSDRLTSITNDAEKTQSANSQPTPPAPTTPALPAIQSVQQIPSPSSSLEPDTNQRSNVPHNLELLTAFLKLHEIAHQNASWYEVPTTPAPLQQILPVQLVKSVVSTPPTAFEPRPEPVAPVLIQDKRPSMEDLLYQIAGWNNQMIPPVDKVVLESTALLPETIRVQVMQSMQDIQNYIDHSLYSSAIRECLRVIDMAPYYLDVHQVLSEIYVLQDNIEQAITKYAILVDTYIVIGRIEDAIAIYRRVLQLEPNNLAYRIRLINLLASHGNKEDLLLERMLIGESYLRLGYFDLALTVLEQALQEDSTSIPTRLNYALALQKLGRTQQAVAEYQHVLQVDPHNVTALVRWHIVMITSIGAARATSLEILARIRWQLRGEKQRNAEGVIREYSRAMEIYPHNADVYFALGQIYHQVGLFERALDSYALAMRDSAVEVLARMSAAQCLLVQGKPEAAIQHFEQTLQVVRCSPTSLNPATWAARPREEGEKHQTPEMEISQQLARACRRAGSSPEAVCVWRSCLPL